MSTVTLEREPMTDAIACHRCGTLNLVSASACGDCLLPLHGPAVLPGPRRVSLAAPALCLALAVTAGGTARFFLRRRAGGRPTRPPAGGAVPAWDRVNGALGKFEPERGCLIGAFVVRDINISGSMRRWVELTGKPHASYLLYVGYGKPFPAAWVASVRQQGAAPNLALEPNGGLGKVQDDEYLRGFAREAAQSGGPVFLRFASEMNGPWTAYSGSPRAYRQKFRLVARVMQQEAPNVAMVWTPYCSPLRPIPDYYPGDDAVDWVGVNIYSVHHHDGDNHHPAHREDPAQLLQPIYDLYADRKPLQISEFASTHFCKACGGYTADFAMNKMIRMYRSLPAHFPRVKMIYWFSWDTVSGKAACNNYAVTDDPVIRDTYRRLVAPDYFLTRVPGGRPNRD